MSRGIILDWKGDASALVVFRQENKDRADSRTSPISVMLSTAPEEVVPTVPMTKNGTYEKEKKSATTKGRRRKSRRTNPAALSSSMTALRASPRNEKPSSNVTGTARNGCPMMRAAFDEKNEARKVSRRDDNPRSQTQYSPWLQCYESG